MDYACLLKLDLSQSQLPFHYFIIPLMDTFECANMIHEIIIAMFFFQESRVHSNSPVPQMTKVLQVSILILNSQPPGMAARKMSQEWIVKPLNRGRRIKGCCWLLRGLPSWIVFFATWTPTRADFLMLASSSSFLYNLSLTIASHPPLNGNFLWGS